MNASSRGRNGNSAPIGKSRRILLVHATDALNSGMTFTSPERETLVALGKLPILPRTDRLMIALTDRRVAASQV